MRWLRRRTSPVSSHRLSGAQSPSRKTTGETTKDPRIRVVDAALAFAVQRKHSDYVIDVLLDIRNNVLRDMESEVDG